MRKVFSSFLISCLTFTIQSCGKSTDENVNDVVSKTSNNVEGVVEDNNDTAIDLDNILSGGGSETACDNSKAFIVGNAVTEKNCHPDCPEMKGDIWNLDKCMTVVGDSSYAADATEHDGSIYIADDGGFYWIVGKSITKHSLNYSSGYKLS